MMRELDTVSPVVWPAWCYTGEGQGEAESASAELATPAVAATTATAAVTPKARGKRRNALAAAAAAAASAASARDAASSGAMNGGADHLTPNNGTPAGNAANGNADAPVTAAAPASSSANGTSTAPGPSTPVKTERLSPAAAASSAANTPDNNSSSSRSATPSLSYPGTPPGSGGGGGGAQERGASPASFPAGHIKQMEQMMTRNYSDFMRSLAAKYNNSNPNDYFGASARNGYPVSLDARYNPFKGSPTPLVSLMGAGGPALPASLHKGAGAASGSGSVGGSGAAGNGSAAAAAVAAAAAAGSSAFSAAAAVAAAAAAAKEGGADAKKAVAATTPASVDPQQALYSFGAATAFGAGAAANPTLFPPMIDMRSTQALLGLVRTANAHNASQLETYLKGSAKRPSPSESSPLDLSAGAVPHYGKKARSSKNAVVAAAASVSEALFKNDSVLSIPMMDALRPAKDRLGSKRLGSVSPKPLSRYSSGGGSGGGSSGGGGGSSAGSSPRMGAAATVTSQHVYGRNLPCMSACSSGGERACASGDANAVTHWGVEDVCSFVASIDICAEYAQNFRDQRIDGSSLPLLTEEHLINTLGLKLGPALKLRALLARRMGSCAICLHCVHCHTAPSAAVAAATPVSPAQTPPASALGRPSSTGV